MGRPLATYRLQLRPGFGFAAARGVVGYLRDLGVTDLYLSPVFEARAGSEHGYDVTDPTCIREELGGRAGLDAVVSECRGAGIGVVLDIVPNHLAATPLNPWWRAVLRDGPESAAAPIFDIDWNGNDACPPGKVLLPILDRDVGDAIAAGVVRLEAGGEGWTLRVAGDALPVRGPVGPGEDVGAVLDRQAYVLARWRPGVAPNYRRFFDIDDLVGVRVEDPAVFDRTHALVLELVRDGAVTGLRVDHVDGLTDPLAYLERLRAAIGPDVYLVVEKILTGDEELRSAWPVAGTTGYDALADLDAVFVDPSGLRALDDGVSFAEVAHAARREVLDLLFPGELRGCTDVAAPEHGWSSDARTALRELTAACPVYRTYVDADGASEEDRRVIAEAVERAAEAGADRDALTRLWEMLLVPADLAFTRRWQQLTAPVMAKGHEDTAAYRHVRLVSLNEVGGDPDRPLGSDARARFHDRNRARVQRGLHGLTATSTHDTKRSEDVRARINVLSELPTAWNAAFSEWRRANDGGVAVGDQRLLAQTLLGVWPVAEGSPTATDLDTLHDRVRAYLVKAAREAKRSTSWLEPDERYENALAALVGAQFADGGARFLAAFGDLAPAVAFFGALDSLASLPLKLAMPGVPDLYQGCELWDHSLVDPDNRRTVDFGHRRALLDEFRGTVDPRALLEAWPDGRIKLWIAHRALALRLRHARLCHDGEYVPLAAEGAYDDHVVAFARAAADHSVIAIAPRLCTRLVPAGTFPVGDVWGDTRLALPPGAPTAWLDAFTGARIEVSRGHLDLASVLTALPVALLGPS